MTEALYLGKPSDFIPIRNQFEQMLERDDLERLGCALHDLQPSLRRLRMFLEGRDDFRGNIRRDQDLRCGNEAPFRKLEERLEGSR